MGWDEFEDHFKVLQSNYEDYLVSLACLEREYDIFKVKRFNHFFKI
jgi:hypothetical protein